MTEPAVKITRLLKCHAHGDRKWQGHIMCATCGKVYQTSEPTAARYAPPTCTGCGAKLMPDNPQGDALGMHGAAVIVREGDPDPGLKAFSDGDFSARSICYLCFRKVVKKHNGRVPMPENN